MKRFIYGGLISWLSLPIALANSSAPSSDNSRIVSVQASSVVLPIPWACLNSTTLQSGYWILCETDVNQAVQLQSIFNIIHYQTIVKIDFIVRKDSPYRQLEFERRIKKIIADFTLWVVSPEDLIISKLFWAKDSKSELQLNDVSSIIKYQAEKLDWEYIKYWVKELGLGQIWGEVE